MPYFPRTLAFLSFGVAQSDQCQVIRMASSLSRRSILSSLLAAPAAAMLLSACSDSGETQAQTPAAPAETPTASTAAANSPQSTGTVGRIEDEGLRASLERLGETVIGAKAPKP